MKRLSRRATGAGAFAIAAAIALTPTAAFADPAEVEPFSRPAAAALNNPLEPGTYAGDTADGPVIVEFSRDGFTDRTEEDWDIATVLLPSASELRVTDGGDGSAATWTTVLTGADVLVLPEGDNWETGGTAAISDAALEVIRTWVSAGRLILGTGSYLHGAIVSELTGVDFTTEFNNNNSEGPWQRVSDNTALPVEVPNGNYTGGLMDYSLFSDEQKAVITPLYYSETTDNLGVGRFAIGTGSYLYYAYDWYPDGGELTDGTREAWNNALLLGAGGDFTEPEPEPEPPVEEEPELAETGDAASEGLLLGAGSLLLAGVLALLVTRRRALR